MTSLYCALDILGGIFTIVVWAPLLLFAIQFHANAIFGIYEMSLALTIFVVTFSIQVGVGHMIFEEGRDDTEQNIGEFLRTWNPIYISCIPFYHHMEIIFMLGFRPRIYRNVKSYQRGRHALS
jgi:uncharacterized membrane protein YGL010W